jgi:hypothetical protein
MARNLASTSKISNSRKWEVNWEGGLTASFLDCGNYLEEMPD